MKQAGGVQMKSMTAHAVRMTSQRNLMQQDIHYVLQNGSKIHEVGACCFYLCHNDFPQEDRPRATLLINLPWFTQRHWHNFQSPSPFLPRYGDCIAALQPRAPHRFETGSGPVLIGFEHSLQLSLVRSSQKLFAELDACCRPF
jgi:hypothetical protein